MALNKQLKDRFSKSLNDTIIAYKYLLNRSSDLLALERLARKNITVQKVNEKNILPTKDASIIFYEFEKKNVNSFFSPTRSFLRINNNIDSGLINGRPFIDYELRNDDIYQLMFQLRSSYAPKTGKSTIGIGAELKLNKVSFNGVLSYGNKDRWFNPIFGIRYDFAKIVFK